MGNVTVRGTVSFSPVGTGVGADLELSTLVYGGTSTTAVDKNFVSLGLVANVTNYVAGAKTNPLSREQASAVIPGNPSTGNVSTNYTTITGGSQTIGGNHSESTLFLIAAGTRWRSFSPALVVAGGIANVCSRTTNTITENVYESVPPAGTPALPNDRNAMNAGGESRPGSNVKPQNTDYSSSNCELAPHVRAGVQVSLQPWENAALSAQLGYQNLGGHGVYFTAGGGVSGDWDLALIRPFTSKSPEPAIPPAPPPPPTKCNLRGAPNTLMTSDTNNCKPCTHTPPGPSVWYGDSTCVAPVTLPPPPQQPAPQAQCTLTGAPNNMKRNDPNCKPCNETKQGKKIFKDSEACRNLPLPLPTPSIPAVGTSTAGNAIL